MEAIRKLFSTFPKTTVQAIDRDKKVSLIAKKFEKEFPKRFKFNQIKFSQLDTLSEEYARCSDF